MSDGYDRIIAKWDVERAELRSQNQALQERAEKAEAEVVRLRRIFEVLAHEDWRGNKPAHITIAENALSSPEETLPEMGHQELRGDRPQRTGRS